MLNKRELADFLTEELEQYDITKGLIFDLLIKFEEKKLLGEL